MLNAGAAPTNRAQGVAYKVKRKGVNRESGQAVKSSPGGRSSGQD